MARTDEGRQLTETHRKAQLMLAGSVEAAAPELDSLIDLGDLEGGFPDWYMGFVSLRNSGREASRRLAAAYVEQFGLVEADVEVEAGMPVLDEVKAARDAYMDTVVMSKARIGRGVSPEEAWRIQSAIAYGKLGQAALDAGRRTVTTAQLKYSGKPGRWRRVSDGNPCAFCGMLVGRGPVYKQDTVTFRSHKHCGCSAELVFGDWEPTEREALWRASYLQAALDAEEEFGPKWARTAASENNILYRMRRNSPQLFHDGVWEVNATSKTG